MQGYKHRRGNSWELFISDGFDSEGKRLRHTRTLKPILDGDRFRPLSTDEADDALRDFIREIQGGMYASRMTVSEYLDYWYNTFIDPPKLPKNAKKYATNTKINYKTHIETYLKPYLGHILLRELNCHDIARMWNKIATDNEGLEKISIHGVFRVLRTALESAVGVYIDRNPAKDKLARPPLPTKKEILEKHNVLNIDEAVSLLGAAKSEWHTAIKRFEFTRMMVYGCISMAFFQSMRQGEILGLSLSELDFEKRTIKVSEQLISGGNNIEFGDPKTEGSYRVIRMTKIMFEILTEIKKFQDIAKAEAKILWKDYNLVFTQPDGRPLYAHSLSQNHFKKLLKKAGIEKKVRFQDLRGSTATLLYELGEDPWVVASICGHTTTQTAKDYYVHNKVQNQDNAMNRLEMLFALAEGKQRHAQTQAQANIK